PLSEQVSHGCAEYQQSALSLPLHQKILYSEKLSLIRSLFFYNIQRLSPLWHPVVPWHMPSIVHLEVFRMEFPLQDPHYPSLLSEGQTSRAEFRGFLANNHAFYPVSRSLSCLQRPAF